MASTSTMTLPAQVRGAVVADGLLLRWRSLDGGIVTMTPAEPTEPTPLDEGVYVFASDVAAHLLGVASHPDSEQVSAKDALSTVALALLDYRP